MFYEKTRRLNWWQLAETSLFRLANDVDDGRVYEFVVSKDKDENEDGEGDIGIDDWWIKFGTWIRQAPALFVPNGGH